MKNWEFQYKEIEKVLIKLSQNDNRSNEKKEELSSEITNKQMMIETLLDENRKLNDLIQSKQEEANHLKELNAIQSQDLDNMRELEGKIELIIDRHSNDMELLKEAQTKINRLEEQSLTLLKVNEELNERVSYLTQENKDINTKLVHMTGKMEVTLNENEKLTKLCNEQGNDKSMVNEKYKFLLQEYELLRKELEQKIRENEQIREIEEKVEMLIRENIRVNEELQAKKNELMGYKLGRNLNNHI